MVVPLNPLVTQMAWMNCVLRAYSHPHPCGIAAILSLKKKQHHLATTQFDASLENKKSTCVSKKINNIK